MKSRDVERGLRTGSASHCALYDNLDFQLGAGNPNYRTMLHISPRGRKHDKRERRQIL